MADRNPSYAGFGYGSGSKSGLTEKDRDKIHQRTLLLQKVMLK